MNKKDLEKLKRICDSIRAKDADPLDKISKTVNELWTKYTMKLKGSAPRYRLGATANGDVELTIGYTGPVVAKGNAAVEKFLRELVAGKRDSAKDAVKTSARLDELYPQFSRNTRISIVGKNGVYYSGVLKSVPDRFDKAQASEIEMKSDGSVIIRIKDSAKAKDAEAVIYQVTTSQDKMGRLQTEYFGSAEEVLRKHKGRIDPSSGYPRLEGFRGPMNNGYRNGKRVFLYEDKNTYLSMDSKAKAELG